MPTPPYYFTQVAPFEPASKPRNTSLGMVADWGIGRHAQADLLENAAPFFDFAKIAVGISRLLPAPLLDWKIKSYLEAGIEPFPGGQFLEYAHLNGTEAAYLDAVGAAGFRCCEISDNLAPVGLEWKVGMIRKAVDEHGMMVLGEVGKKEGLDRSVGMQEDACACLDAGARVILLEAAELVHADVELRREVEETVRSVGLEKVMFELPGPWIAGVHQCDIHAMRSELIRRYGPEVNLGNIAPVDLVSLEAYRQGLGVNAGSQADEK